MSANLLDPSSVGGRLPGPGPAAAPPRRRAPAAGSAMVVGAVCLAVAEALHVEVGGEWTVTALLESFAAHPGRWTTWAVLLMATGPLLLPGVLAWWRLARERGGRGRSLTTAGTVVTVASLVAMVGFGASHADGVALVGGVTPVAGALVEGYERAESSSPGLLATSGATVLGFHLGVPLLLGGLVRARLVRPWLGVVGGAAAVAALVVGDLSWVLGAVAFAVVAGVLGVLGVRLWSRGPASS
ncbi:hypothetical protein [uncultured Pseudokineococcus sp.]|uniref:hypothetical protein n=1 Tax=uncultured Pseudokineococcus sp. TaxID=1642928 RepID=UPI00262D92BA|nr:hypothetical protein [uncultured Pseudokineococcus sp.]